jgi:hypothetical protein
VPVLLSKHGADGCQRDFRWWANSIGHDLVSQENQSERNSKLEEREQPRCESEQSMTQNPCHERNGSEPSLRCASSDHPAETAQVHICSLLRPMRKHWQGGTVPSAKERRGKQNLRTFAEAERHEDSARNENGGFDLHRQVDTEGFVFAEREALSTRTVAATRRKHLPANADPNSSESRIHRTNRPARDGNEAGRCRVFPDGTRKDTGRSAQRNVPLVETTWQKGACESTPYGRLDLDVEPEAVSSVASVP